MVHAKKAPDSEFLDYLPLIEATASDPRNFVFKAVSWALRSIGKRSLSLQEPALDTATRLAASTDRTKRRIGTEAVRELTAEKTRARLERRAQKGSSSNRPTR